jgi:LytR cell envelope-related transcriptional attenuator
MAAARTHGSLLELSRHRIIRVALISVGAIALLTGLALLVPTHREHVEGHAYAIPSGRNRIVVEVLNGTRRPGFARVATRVLRGQGIDVVFFGNAESPVESTRVIVRRGEPGHGKDVADALGAGRVLIQPDSLRRVDVSVLLGDDYRPRLPLHP